MAQVGTPTSYPSRSGAAPGSRATTCRGASTSTPGRNWTPLAVPELAPDSIADAIAEGRRLRVLFDERLVAFRRPGPPR